MPNTIKTLPETTSTLLCIQLTGAICEQDFLDYCGGPIQKMVERQGWYNLYVHYDQNYHGWLPEPADTSFRYISTYGPKARRAAYVNPPDSKLLMMKMLEPLIPAEIRFFDEEEQQKALQWVQENS